MIQLATPGTAPENLEAFAAIAEVAGKRPSP
jgi:hypothetical protein